MLVRRQTSINPSLKSRITKLGLPSSPGRSMLKTRWVDLPTWLAWLNTRPTEPTSLKAVAEPCTYGWRWNLPKSDPQSFMIHILVPSTIWLVFLKIEGFSISAPQAKICRCYINFNGCFSSMHSYSQSIM